MWMLRKHWYKMLKMQQFDVVIKASGHICFLFQHQIAEPALFFLLSRPFSRTWAAGSPSPPLFWVEGSFSSDASTPCLHVSRRLKPNSSFHQSHYLPFLLSEPFLISPLQFWETLCCWLSSDLDFCHLPSSPHWSHTTSRRIRACWLFSGSSSGSRWYDGSQDLSHQLDFFFFFLPILVLSV